MPRGKKTEERTPPQTGISKRVFIEFLTQVKDLRQDLDDANMKHAAEWKEAEKRGIHPQAAKLIARLDKMEEAKRTDFLLSFFKYLPWMGWGKQGEMFEKPIAALNPDAGGDDDGEDGAGGGSQDEREPDLLPPGSTGDRQELPSAERALAEEKEELEEPDETPAEHVEELASAGFTFALGKQAGEAGAGIETCPHPEGSPSFKAWMNGYAQGVKNRESTDKNTAASSNGEGAEEPAPRRRGGRRAAGEGSTAVH